jgi:hypothetical protein
MVQNLPLELIDIIVKLCVSESLFLFATNRFFRDRDALVRGVGRKRVLELKAVFYNNKILTHALCTPRIVRLSCARIRGDVAWSRASIRAAYQSGDVQVLDRVVSKWREDPKRTMPMVARFNRTDIFSGYVMDLGSGCEVSHWMESAFRSLSGTIRGASFCTISTFLDYFLVPACVGGSTSMLKAAEKEVKRRMLTEQCAWHSIFRNNTYVLRMVCAAGCATNAAVVLDFLSTQITECGLHRNDRVCRHMASAVLMFVHDGASRSALEWAMQFGEDSNSVLHDVRLDAQKGFVVFVDTWLPIEHTKMFSTRSPEVYRLLRDQCGEGGWMHASAGSTCTAGSIAWTVLKRLRDVTRKGILTQTELELLEECIADASREYVCFGGRWTASIINELKMLLDISVSSAYTTARRIHDIKATTKGSEERKTLLLRGKSWCFVHQLVTRAVECKNCDVLDTCVLDNALLDFRSLSFWQRRKLVVKACASDNTRCVNALARSECEFYVSDIIDSMKAGRLRATSCILKNRPTLSTTDVGRCALQLGDSRAVGIAAENDCFKGDADLLSQAHDIADEPPTKKRRCLPVCFTSASPRLLDPPLLRGP